MIDSIYYNSAIYHLNKTGLPWIKCTLIQDELDFSVASLQSKIRKELLFGDKYTCQDMYIKSHKFQKYSNCQPRPRKQHKWHTYAISF